MKVKTVLIVDDSRVSRMMVSAIIKSQYKDWKIEEAASGDEAVSKLTELHPDIAVVDFNMPGSLDGLQVAEKLRQQSATTQIILLTANIQDSIRDKAAAMGISFVGKPITEEKILTALA